MMTPQLFAFDLDGTLADTESVSIPSGVETMRTHFGIPMTVDLWLTHFHGLAGKALTDAVVAHFGIPIDYPEYARLRAESVPQMFANGVQPAPGMLQAVRNLAAAGHQLCICSNSLPERIDATLEAITGQHSAGVILPNLFAGHIFSATGTSGTGVAKPAPDVYLAAAKYYKADPTKCVAVEDTPVGVTAAVAAGFTCLGYTGLGHKGNAAAPGLLAAGATTTFAHWDDFLPLLKTL